MNRFKYKALDDKQGDLKGEVEARDIRQAASILRGKNYTVTSLEEVKPDVVNELLMKLQKPKLTDISNFTRQLSTMIVAGLPLVQALQILRDQSKPAMARVVNQVAQDVEGGISLADAMAKSGDTFGTVYVALVRAGESAGVLDQILKKLADNLEKQREFSSKTKGAMVYPAIVFVVMIIVGILVMIFVVPPMTSMFKDFGSDLPLPTKILIGISNLFVTAWPLLIVVFGFGGVLFSRWKKTEIGSLMMENLQFKIPVYNNFKKDVLLTEFARTMGMLSTAGISVLDALRIVADTMDSQTYAQGIKQAADMVEKGSTLAESLQLTTDFPPVLGQMIAVGEQTGKVDETLLKLADFYESETETRVKALTTAIEPLIMVVMGIAVGFMVFAIIMPIYGLTSKF